jgi:3-methyladenine DNA glycosylase AlkD
MSASTLIAQMGVEQPQGGAGSGSSATATPRATGASWPARPAGDHAARTVAARQSRAIDLGTRLGDMIDDPAAFASALASAFHERADAEYRAGQAFVAPGIGPTHGVRTPLQVALRRAFQKQTRRASSSELLSVADRLLREPEREARWFAISTLERTIGREPERTWQLLRRAARDADDWITVDTLAHPYGKGILAEAYRWAELEQLTISPSRWERRLVGSTIATMPYVNRTDGRTRSVAATGLRILGTLIGDAEPDVQKALAWAYRSMAIVDGVATTEAVEAEARAANANADGHRAWVIRDTLSKLDPDAAAGLREQLVGIRRAAGAPATSKAAVLAEQFASMGLGRSLPEPPLT